MPRRVRMPAADELFRTTAGSAGLLHGTRRDDSPELAARIRTAVPAPAAEQEPAAQQATEQPAPGRPAQYAQRFQRAQSAQPTERTRPVPESEPEPEQHQAPRQRAQQGSAPRRSSGRERHDEKITVYVSPDELLGLERARITLRGEYSVAVDRGRIVREAVAALLADLDARGPDSILVKRLSGSGASTKLDK